MKSSIRIRHLVAKAIVLYLLLVVRTVGTWIGINPVVNIWEPLPWMGAETDGADP